jgi:hypothetical protein
VERSLCGRIAFTSRHVPIRIDGLKWNADPKDIAPQKKRNITDQEQVNVRHHMWAEGDVFLLHYFYNMSTKRKSSTVVPLAFSTSGTTETNQKEEGIPNATLLSPFECTITSIRSDICAVSESLLVLTHSDTILHFWTKLGILLPYALFLFRCRTAIADFEQKKLGFTFLNKDLLMLVRFIAVIVIPSIVLLIDVLRH